MDSCECGKLENKVQKESRRNRAGTSQPPNESEKRMNVQHLQLKEFRNYASVDLSFSAGLNIFTGANAQGKTNLLEAIYYASTLRSFRSARDADLIRWNNSEAKIEVLFERDSLTNQIAIRIPSQGKRSAVWNEQPINRLNDLIGKLTTVSFITQDLLLVKGEPTDRRRFLDYELGGLEHRYLYSWMHYRRCLEQRNNLLKTHAEGSGSLDTLDEWDSQLVRYGMRLFHARRQFLDDLSIRMEPVHHSITGDSEMFKLDYIPGLSLDDEKPQTEADWQYVFEKALQRVRREEIRRATTLVGPHRDDFRLLINEKDARQFASQGQQRTCALSIKLAEIVLIQDQIGESPVVLLDDVFSDLDPDRRHRLMAFLRSRSQTFITCTELNSFPKKILSEATRFKVEEGMVDTHA